jgi:hypothetical protein
MSQPERPTEDPPAARGLNPTLLALLAGVLVLLLVIAYFATNRNSDQDKLGNEVAAANGSQAATPEKRCASQATYDLIKRELFRRAAQLRGSDQAAYDKLSAYAVVRMENPVLESEDKDTGAVNCSGSLSLDLPPNVVAVGGRHSLMSDIDYTVQPAADGSGMVVLLRNADSIVAPLATLGRIAQPVQPPAEDSNAVAPEEPDANVGASESLSKQAGPPSAYPGRPSYDCSQARTRGEIAVCSDSGLSALDVNMATQYRRALAVASPEEQQVLRQTRDRFLAYRDHCPTDACIGDAYVGRMREIRDIMEGRWQPRR